MQDIIVITIVVTIVTIAIYKGVKSYKNKDGKDCDCSGGGCK